MGSVSVRRARERTQAEGERGSKGEGEDRWCGRQRGAGREKYDVRERDKQWRIS